jgi:hypothetical protein
MVPLGSSSVYRSECFLLLRFLKYLQKVNTKGYHAKKDKSVRVKNTLTYTQMKIPKAPYTV